MIKIVAAMDADKLIGRKGSLPWRLPNDLKHFKETTLGNIIVMGRKTFEDVGILPGRTTIVLSKKYKRLELPRFTYENDINNILELAKENDVYIVGGVEIYKTFLPHADEMILTHIKDIFIGDAYFPDFDEEEWLVVDSKDFTTEDGHPHNHSIKRYVKRN